MPFYHESEEEEDFPDPSLTQPTKPSTQPSEPNPPSKQDPPNKQDPLSKQDSSGEQDPPSIDKIPDKGSQRPENMSGDKSIGDNDGLTAGEPEPQYYKLPSKLEDLDDRPAALKKWSSIIDGVVEKLLVDKKAAGKTTHFFNAAREADAQTETLSIKWLAFPKNLETAENKWAAADKRENQDEYCEWEVEREGGELKSVAFTTELPEVSIRGSPGSYTGLWLIQGLPTVLWIPGFD
jgi:hypothetical protein